MFDTAATFAAYSLAIASAVGMGDLAKSMADDLVSQRHSQIAYVRAAASGDEEAAQRHLQAALNACQRIVVTAKVALKANGQDTSQLACSE